MLDALPMYRSNREVSEEGIESKKKVELQVWTRPTYSWDLACEHKGKDIKNHGVPIYSIEFESLTYSTTDVINNAHSMTITTLFITAFSHVCIGTFILICSRGKNQA